MHCIQRNIIELTAPTEQDAFEWQQTMSRFTQEQLLPALAALFDRLAGSPDQVLRVDRLEVSVRVLQKENWPAQLVEQIVQVVEAELQQQLRAVERPAPAAKAIQVVPVAETYFQAFLYFLQHGTLPWWASFPDFADFQEKVLAALPNHSAQQLRISLRQALRETYALERLFGQFSWPLITHIFRVLIAPAGFAAFETLVNDWLTEWQMNPSRHQSSHGFWVAHKKTLTRLLSSDAMEPNATATESQEVAKQAEGSLAEKNVVYVQNAGLVLLHPFLQQYLETCDLVAGAQLGDPAQAVHALQYLATARWQTPEYDLALPKLLCGLPLQIPIPPETELPDTLAQEATQLLEAVIGYWSVLKNTSPEGLRESFLKRLGKLSQKPDGDWLLQVEQQSYDLLLDHLPWSYSLIQLPWMPTKLWVEWT